MDKSTREPSRLLDAIEQYAAAVEQDVRSKLRFTSYAARESAKRKRSDKQKAMRAALTAAQQQGQGGGEAAPEPFAWFAFADQNGPVPLEVYGWDRKSCLYAVLTLARSEGWKGTVNGYLFHKGWTVKPAYTAAPSAPVGVDGRAREAVALALDEAGHHTEANNVRKGIDLDEYRIELSAARIAVAQQPAAVDEAMANLRDAILRNDGLTRKNTLAAFRAVEDALATQHQEPTT